MTKADPLDQVFLTLYRELYFRHVYARLQPTIDDRFQSYENICELFNYLLSMSNLISDSALRLMPRF
jgi:translation initiation factor 3 subunit L